MAYVVSCRKLMWCYTIATDEDALYQRYYYRMIRCSTVKTSQVSVPVTVQTRPWE